MTTAELIEKLRAADPEGTARVWIDDGDWGCCVPREPITREESGAITLRLPSAPCVILRADPRQMIE